MAFPKTRRQTAIPSTTAARLRRFEEERDHMVDTIRALVEIESPSDNKSAVDRLGQHVAEKFAALGGAVRIHKASAFGDHVQVDFAGASTKSPFFCWDTSTLFIRLARWPLCLVTSRLDASLVLAFSI